MEAGFQDWRWKEAEAGGPNNAWSDLVGAFTDNQIEELVPECKGLVIELRAISDDRLEEADDNSSSIFTT